MQRFCTLRHGAKLIWRARIYATNATQKILVHLFRACASDTYRPITKGGFCTKTGSCTKTLRPTQKRQNGSRGEFNAGAVNATGCGSQELQPLPACRATSG